MLFFSVWQDSFADWPFTTTYGFAVFKDGCGGQYYEYLPVDGAKYFLVKENCSN